MKFDQKTLDQVFTNARSFNKFFNKPVPDELLREIYDLVKWAPTSMNTQPARYVFLRTDQAKARLLPALMAGNQQKTREAPVTVIIATDTQFYEHLPIQFPAYDARPLFAGNATLAETTAFRNGSLQGAYFMLAARMLGLDVGPMSGFDNAQVDKEFFPDGKWKSNFITLLGYGDPSGNYPRCPRLPFEVSTQLL